MSQYIDRHIITCYVDRTELPNGGPVNLPRPLGKSCQKYADEGFGFDRYDEVFFFARRTPALRRFYDDGKTLYSTEVIDYLLKNSSELQLDYEKDTPETILRYLLALRNFNLERSLSKYIPKEIFRDALIYYIERYFKVFPEVLELDWSAAYPYNPLSEVARTYAAGIVICVRRSCQLCDLNFIELFDDDVLFKHYALKLLRLHYISEGCLSDNYFDSLFSPELLNRLDTLLGDTDFAINARLAPAALRFVHFLIDLVRDDRDCAEFLLKCFGLHHDFCWLDDYLDAALGYDESKLSEIYFLSALKDDVGGENHFRLVFEREPNNILIGRDSFKYYLRLKCFHCSTTVAKTELAKSTLYVFTYKDEVRPEYYIL